MSLFKDSISEASEELSSERNFALRHERLVMEKLALARDMSEKVIARAKVYGDGAQRKRYVDYSPEDVYRAVEMLVDERRASSLEEMLKGLLTDYTAYLTEQLNEFAHACGLSTLAMHGAPCEAVEGEDGDGNPSEAISVRSFHMLMDTWDSFSFAMEELQLVWSPFAYRYVMTATVFKDMLGATVVFWMNAFNEVPSVFEAALEGFVRLMGVDIAAGGALPSPPSERKRGRGEAGGRGGGGGGSAMSSDSDEAAASGFLTPPPHSSLSFPPTAPSIARLRRFSDLLFMTQNYHSRLQPRVLAALGEFYAAAAARMLRTGVFSAAYFDFVRQAMLRERRRVRAYLHAQTALPLQAVVERALLGEAGMALLRRDFSSLLSADARGGEGLETLALAWRLLSRSAEVSRDPPVAMFRAHVETTAADLAIAIASSARAEPASGEGGRRAVRQLLLFIVSLRRAVVKCFPKDQKRFQTQIDEGLQEVLTKYHRPVAEQLARFTDDVFAMVETGELPLEGPHLESPGLLRTHDVVCQSSEEDTKGNDNRHPHCVFLHARDREGGSENGDPTRAAFFTDPNSNASSIFATARDYFEQIVFTCVHFPSNDFFGQLHTQYLARRLLNPNRSVNLAAERCFLRFFESIYGSSFVYKFEGMLKDKENFADLTKQYESFMNSKGAASHSQASTTEYHLDRTTADDVATSPVPSAEHPNERPNPHTMKLTLFFMTTGYWPRRTDTLNLQLPPLLRQSVSNVDFFYESLYPNRHLNWQHHLSQGVLRAQLTPHGAVYELSGTLIQCLVLLHLDELGKAREGAPLAEDSSAHRISVQEICHRLGVDLDLPEVVGSLMGLCQEGFQLLIRTRACSPTATRGVLSPPGVQGGVPGSFPDRGRGGSPELLSPQDYVQLNTAFTLPTHRARIPFFLSPVKTYADSDAEGVSNETNPAVGFSEDQLWQKYGHLLQISVIQYAKPRGMIKHEELLANVLSQKFNFGVSEGLVKRAIEKLLDRGFIERNGKDQYKYVG